MAEATRQSAAVSVQALVTPANGARENPALIHWRNGPKLVSPTSTAPQAHEGAVASVTLVEANDSTAYHQTGYPAVLPASRTRWSASFESWPRGIRQRGHSYNGLVDRRVRSGAVRFETKARRLASGFGGGGTTTVRAVIIIQ